MNLHGTPVSILWDRHPRFNSRVWKEFQDAMDRELKFSTTFRP